MKVCYVQLLRLLTALNCLCVVVGKLSDLNQNHKDASKTVVKNLLDIDKLSIPGLV